MTHDCTAPGSCQDKVRARQHVDRITSLEPAPPPASGEGQHSPLPWEFIEEANGGRWVRDAKGKDICLLPNKGHGPEGNGPIIVLACNSFDDLTAALVLARDTLASYGHTTLLHRFDTALRKAGK
jgi:hypothetical protein